MWLEWVGQEEYFKKSINFLKLSVFSHPDIHWNRWQYPEKVLFILFAVLEKIIFGDMCAHIVDLDLFCCLESLCHPREEPSWQLLTHVS